MPVHLLALLQEGKEKYRFRLHAYCLMTNHLHLVLQVEDIPLSRIIQNVSFRYASYANRCKQQVGHLFQGRYKVLLIDADSYLLELVRYVHNTPVRAGLAQTPEDYPGAAMAFIWAETRLHGYQRNGFCRSFPVSESWPRRCTVIL